MFGGVEEGGRSEKTRIAFRKINAKTGNNSSEGSRREARA